MNGVTLMKAGLSVLRVLVGSSKVASDSPAFMVTESGRVPTKCPPGIITVIWIFWSMETA